MFEEHMDVVQEFTPPQDDTFQLFSGHKESVFCVDFDCTGQYLVSGGQDHIAIIWNVATGVAEFICQGHEDSVHCVKFSPDGAYLCTGDMAGSIRVWLKPLKSVENSLEWKLLTTLNTGDLLWIRWWSPPVNSIIMKSKVDNAGLPNPAVLLAGDEDGLVTAWPVKANLTNTNSAASHAKCLSGTGQPAIDAVILPSSMYTDKPKLAVLYKDGDLRVWDLKTESQITSLQLFSTHSSLSTLCRDLEVYQLISLSPQSLTASSTVMNSSESDVFLITGNGFICPVSLKHTTEMLDSRLKVLDVIKTEDDGSVEALSCSWTHPLFAFGTVTGILGICDTQTLSIRQKWIYIDEDDGQPIGITSLCWSRYKPIFFTTTVKGSLVAWPGISGERIQSPALSSSNQSKDPIPLKIWWGHKAMILDLALPPSNHTTNNNNNVEINSKNGNENAVQLLNNNNNKTLNHFCVQHQMMQLYDSLKLIFPKKQRFLFDLQFLVLVLIRDGACLM
ncbi:unnamed protein product [Trichobilharzia szidati]|nr:unnamed protein product [Trichobilharzia szidati]